MSDALIAYILGVISGCGFSVLFKILFDYLNEKKD